MTDAWTPQDGQPVAPDELVAHAPRAWALACSLVQPHELIDSSLPRPREVLAAGFLFAAAAGQGMDTAGKMIGTLYNAPMSLFWGLSFGALLDLDEDQTHIKLGKLGELRLNVPLKLLRGREGEAAAYDVAALLWAQLSAVEGCSAKDTQRDPDAALQRALAAWAKRAETTPSSAWAAQGGET